MYLVDFLHAIYRFVHPSVKKKTRLQHLNIKWSKLLKKKNLLTPKKDEQIKISNENQLRKVFERKKQKKKYIQSCYLYLYHFFTLAVFVVARSNQSNLYFLFFYHRNALYFSCKDVVYFPFRTFKLSTIQNISIWLFGTFHLFVLYLKLSSSYF